MKVGIFGGVRGAMVPKRQPPSTRTNTPYFTPYSICPANPLLRRLPQA